MPILAVTAALALPLELQLSPGASLEAMPARDDGRVDVILHGNHIDLGPQVGWTVGTGIARARAWELGGDQVLSLQLEDPRTTVAVTSTSTGALLSVSPGSGDAPPAVETASVAAALRGKYDTQACADQPLALVPLAGSDGRWSDAAISEPPPLPQWSAAEPPVVAWTELWDTRRQLRRGGRGLDRERATYRLAALHRGLGQAREAAWYFERAAHLKGGHAAEAHFQAARSRLLVRNWDGARRSARLAGEAGGPPEMVLVALLWAELASDGPDVLGMARALADIGLPVEHERLLGVALTRGECGAEAADLLARARRRTVGAEAARIQLLLADGQLFAGDLAAARRSYAAVRAADLSLPERRLLRTRTRHLALLDLPVERWGSLLPELRKAADLPGEAGAENLYLLAQVNDALGLEREHVEALARLVDRLPRLAPGSVGARLTASWKRRSGRLFAAGRPLDALSLHRAVDPVVLLQHLDHSDPLHEVARAYEHAGLPARSLATWQSAAQLERRLGLDTRPTVFGLARMYVGAGADADALEAIRWLRRHQGDPGDGRLVLLEARVAERTGRLADARRLYASASRSPAVEAEAQVRLALLDAAAGSCPAAMGVLDRAVATPVPEVEGDLVREALLRCFAATGREPEGAAIAVSAAGLAEGDDVRAWADARVARLEAAASGKAPALLAEAAGADPGIWGALAREEASHRAYGAQLARRRLP
jgi:hypothetical protein